MRVVIIGAGLSGLSCAWHLLQAGVEAVVFEKEHAVGGACRTLEREGFSFDLTGHLLHLRLEESWEFLAKLGLIKDLRAHNRRAGVYLAGRITPYPIQIHTTRLPPRVVRDCLLGFIRAWREPQREVASFGEWVLNRFGEGFAQHFFFPYNRKLFCTDPFSLSSEWVGRYVPRPSLEDVVEGALGIFPKGKPVGYNARFWYPRRGGIGILAQTLASPLRKLRLGTPVVALDLEAREVSLEGGEKVVFDVLVATNPLPQLVTMSRGLPQGLLQEAAVLKAVGVWNLNLAVRGRPKRREHWIYCPEETLPFYRVGFPSNHGRLAPAGHHIISIEVSAPSGEAPADSWEQRCFEALVRAGFLAAPEDVLFHQVAVVDPAYVIFDHNRPRAVANLRTFFAQHGVYLCGRWAEWKYSTMEDALWDGAAVARKILGR